MGGENSGRMAGFAIRQTVEAFGARELRVRDMRLQLRIDVARVSADTRA